MAFHNRVRRALVPLIGAVFSTGIAAVICLELAEAMYDLPTHLQITVYAVPVAYWVVFALSFFGVIGKDGAVVIDVGMNRRPSDNKLCGDVDYASVEPVASYITPVPGGVGPMTITMLMQNTLRAAKSSL